MLNLFGISIYAFKIAGGIIVLNIALSILKGVTHNHSHGERTTKTPRNNIGVVPMAIPVVARSGLITVLITNAHDFNFEETLLATLICAILASFFWISLRVSPKVASFLGQEGLKIVSRIMGLILAAIAVQMIISGIKKVFF